MQVYCSDSLEIFFEAQLSLVFYRWTETSKQFNADTFLQEAKNIYFELQKYKPKYLIADDREFYFSIAPDIQDFIAKQVFFAKEKIGLKKVAHICSKELITQLSVEQTFDENLEATYMHRYFENERDARAWIFR